MGSLGTVAIRHQSKLTLIEKRRLRRQLRRRLRVGATRLNFRSPGSLGWAKREAPHFFRRRLEFLGRKLAHDQGRGKSIVPCFQGYGCIRKRPKLADLALSVSLLLKSTSLTGVCDLRAQQCCGIKAICFGAAPEHRLISMARWRVRNRSCCGGRYSAPAC